MVLARPNSAFKYVLLFLLLLLSLTLLSGCGEGDRRWEAPPPVRISFIREAKDLWKFSTSVPLQIDDLGVFSIDHEFDYREHYIYIIIRNRGNHTEHVFNLHLIGIYDLTLQSEKDNKIIVDDDEHSSIKTIVIYPHGQKLTSVPFENGPEFVFLTNKRLYIEYHSLFRQDNSISLNSVEQMTFKRDLGISQLTIDWKPEIKANQGVLVIELPKKGKSLIQNIQAFQKTLAKVDPKVQFTTDYSNTQWIFTFSFMIVDLFSLFGLTFLQTRKNNKMKLGCIVAITVYMTLFVFLFFIWAMLISDISYSEFRQNIHSKG